MNLRDLQYLVAVADHLHFGQAAEASFVSQPTLSTQIKKLEAELGVALIERNPRNVTLTEVGQRVVERARVVLAEADQIALIAKQANDPEAGSVRLGVFPTLAPYLLPYVVPAIHERFPNLELLLVEEKSEVLLQRLRDGQLEAAVLAEPVHASHLERAGLFGEDFLLAVPAGHRLASVAEPVDLSVLIDENMLLLDEGHCLRDQALEVCKLTGAAERRGFRATSLETLRQMVGAGVGITLLPELAVQAPLAPSADVRLMRFADPVPHRDIAMFWRSTSAYAALLSEVAAIISREITPRLGTLRG